jgi:hypothetical protein
MDAYLSRVFLLCGRDIVAKKRQHSDFTIFYRTFLNINVATAFSITTLSITVKNNAQHKRNSESGAVILTVWAPYFKVRITSRTFLLNRLQSGKNVIKPFTAVLYKCL